MRKIKNECKKIANKFDQSRKLKRDMIYTKRLEKIAFSVSEDFCEYIKHNQGVLGEPFSVLEKVIAKIDGCYFDKNKIMNLINQFEKYVNMYFKKYKQEVKASNNPKVKVEIDEIIATINQEIFEMKNIVQQYDNISQIKTLVLNKCLNISSDLGENKYNLGEEFSYLEGAIEEYYGKQEKKMKCVAVGTGAAIALAGIGVGAYAIADHRAEQIMDALVILHGDEENIPEHEYNEYFYENGMPKPGATEQIKNKLLSERLKNIVNKDLKQTTDKIFIEDLKLSYGKLSYYEESSRGPKLVETDGFSISYKTNIQDEKSYIFREDRKEGVMKDEILNHTEKDKKAIETRKFLEGLSIKDCVEILKEEGENRDNFDERLKDTVLEIGKEALEELVIDRDDEER